MYKGITYQISQISSIKIVKITKKNRKDISLKPLKQLIPLALVLLLICLGLFDSRNYLYGFLVGIGTIVVLYFIFRILRDQILELTKNKYIRLSGLSLRMSNGDDPVFISDDRDLLFRVRDALYDAMNDITGNTSISFDNVNIDLTHAENVEIGNVIGG
jgi:hypothetical protein